MEKVSMPAWKKKLKQDERSQKKHHFFQQWSLTQYCKLKPFISETVGEEKPILYTMFLFQFSAALGHSGTDAVTQSRRLTHNCFGLNNAW